MQRGEMAGSICPPRASSAEIGDIAAACASRLRIGVLIGRQNRKTADMYNQQYVYIQRYV